MNAASLTIKMPGTDICNIYLEVETNEKTINTFSVKFNVLIPNRMLFSGLLVSRKNYADTKYYFCSSSQFMNSPRKGCVQAEMTKSNKQEFSFDSGCIRQLAQEFCVFREISVIARIKHLFISLDIMTSYLKSPSDFLIIVKISNH